MYTRAFIRAHDRTTSDGDIHAQLNGGTAGNDNNNKNICFEGDPVVCPACKSIGKTKCIPPYRPWTGHDGRQVNLDGDLCICKCSPPPRLNASFTNMTMTFESHEIFGIAGAEVWIEHVGIKKFAYDQHFLVLNKDTGIPDANRKYRIIYSKGAIEGKTDSNGLTATVKSDTPEKVRIELL